MNACPTYAGIGSRETPPRVFKQMTDIARTLAGRGWRLRLGGAEGADTAFSAGAPPPAPATAAAGREERGR